MGKVLGTPHAQARLGLPDSPIMDANVLSDAW
jgi:hypothetical protein